MPNTTIDDFANTVDLDNEPYHLVLQCLPSYTFYTESFLKICKHNFVVCFLAIYGLRFINVDMAVQNEFDIATGVLFNEICR